MPISREQFDEGLEDLSYKVIAFFKSRSKEAFEASEVAEAVLVSPSSTKTSAEMLAKTKKMEFYLADLVRQGQVDKKTIGDRTYYAFHKD